jgi:hypothetical protein
MAERPVDSAARVLPHVPPILRPYALPAIDEPVRLESIREICLHYDLPRLWARIEADPPRLPFASDGCTGWFNSWGGVSLYPACFLHDVKYWCGYPNEEVARLVADAELMVDVAHLMQGVKMAETMFHGVRLGGQEGFRASFSWGFGRR